MSCVTKYKAARLFLASPFIFFPLWLCWWYQESPKRNYHLNKTKENNWATEFHRTTFYLVLCCHHGDSKWKGARNILCVCVCVHVKANPYLPVNRTLIALALQLVDFHSKENFGINKDGIFKVLKCVIICEFQLEKFTLAWQKKRESEGKREEMASAERRDQAGWMWLLTL